MPAPPEPGPPELGPPPASHDPRELRRHCFHLIHEVTGKLGWRYYLWIPTAMLLSSVFLLPQWFLKFFTESTQRLSDMEASRFVWTLVIFGVGVALCIWVAILFSGILREWLRLTVSMGLRRDAIKALNATRIDLLDSGHRGDWMTRLTSDLRSCEMFLTDSLTDQVRQLTMLVGTIVLFFSYSGTVALILIVAAICLLAFNVVVQRKMGSTLAKARDIEGNVFQSMIETFEGLRTIRSFGAEGFTERRVDAKLRDSFETGMRIIKSMAGLMGINELGSQLVITGVLTIAAYRIAGASLTAGEALVYPFYINMFLGSAKGLAGAAYEWNRFFMEGGRLAALLYDEAQRIDDDGELRSTIADRLPSVQSLAVANLSVSYGTGPPVIDGFQFSLRRGEIIALMGPSGCGKSTFLETFSGLRPADQGEFTIGFEDGSERVSPAAPVILSAFVEQQPYLFVGTIRENVVMGSEGVADEAIWHALSEVGLEEIVRFRGGLDHVLNDRGRNLSVGQQYRLALCRALVCQRPFILLDEPFAALDVESVARVAEALHVERDRGAGIVLVTHLAPNELETTKLITMGEW